MLFVLSFLVNLSQHTMGPLSLFLLLIWAACSQTHGFLLLPTPRPLVAASGSSGDDDWYSDFDEWNKEFLQGDNDSGPQVRENYDRPPRRRGGSRPYRRDTSMDHSNVNVEEIEALIDSRSQARREGDYDTADAIRDQLLDDHGVQVWDQEQTWRSGCSNSGSGRRRPGGWFGGSDDGPRNNSRSRPPRDFGPLGHDYELSEGAGPNQSQFDEETIHGMIAERLQHKLSRNFEAADSIQGALISGGVSIHDGKREWRADGVSFGEASSDGRPGRERGSRGDRNRPYTQSEYSTPPETLDAEEIQTIQDLVEKRTAAKITRNFSTADDIRAVLKDDYNVFIEDRLREWSIGGDFGPLHSANQDQERPWKRSRYSQRSVDADTEATILDLLDQRSQAKIRRDYNVADSIRENLLENFNVQVNDRKREWSMGDTSGDSGKDRPFVRRGGGDLTSAEEAEIMTKVQERFDAKRSSDYETADAIRDELEEKYSVKIDDRSREWRVFSDKYVLSPEMSLNLDEETITFIETKLQERLGFKKAQRYDEADSIRTELRESYGVTIDDRVREWRVVDETKLSQLSGQAQPSLELTDKVVNDDDVGFDFDAAIASIDDSLSEEEDLAEENVSLDGESEEAVDEESFVVNDLEIVNNDDEVAGSDNELLSSFTVVELKEKLREAGLPVSGRKAELIERLQNR